MPNSTPAPRSGRLLLACLLAALPTLPKAALAQTETEVVVPMRLVDGMPAVDVFVNGQGPFTFRIDTGGAGQARVDSAVAQQLKLTQIGEARGSAGASGPAVAMPILRLDSLKVGPLEFKNVEAPSRNYNERGGARTDGILCFNLFADYLFTLDYPAKQVRLRRGALPVPDGKRILPFEMPNRIPAIRFDLGGESTTAHLDSGNMAAGFMLTEGQIGKLKFSAEPRVVGRGRTISGDFEIREAPLAGDIRIGAFRFKDPTVRFASAFPNANVGAGVLREFAITFDQANLRVKWERASELVTLTPPAPPRPATALPPPTAAEAAAYTGTYGARTISLVDGHLHLQRTGGPRLKLIRIGIDEFGLEEFPDARIRFGKNPDGLVVELQVRNPAGEWETAPRR